MKVTMPVLLHGSRELSRMTVKEQIIESVTAELKA